MVWGFCMKNVCSAGGLIIKDNNVLLVKIMYGANKDHWMIPGGFVEKGESFEEAAMREVKEETGIIAKPKRLIGVRTGIKELLNVMELNIYFAYEMEFISGSLVVDGFEIVDVQFRPIDDVLIDTKVVSLTQEILRSYKNALPHSGLSKVEKCIQTNNKYTNYDVYTLV
jgi:8-oxo-dGTP diphosphatase